MCEQDIENGTHSCIRFAAGFFAHIRPQASPEPLRFFDRRNAASREFRPCGFYPWRGERKARLLRRHSKFSWSVTSLHPVNILAFLAFPGRQYELWRCAMPVLHPGRSQITSPVRFFESVCRDDAEVQAQCERWSNFLLLPEICHCQFSGVRRT
jgi:hypothetical protein